MIFVKIPQLIKCLSPTIISFIIRIYIREYGIKELIEFTQSNERLWDSVLLMTLIITGCQFIQTASQNLGEIVQQIEGSKMIQDLQKRLLKKSFKINLNQEQKYTRSTVIHMINQDCQKFDSYYLNFSMIIIIPIQILHSIFVLYKKLGWYWIIVFVCLVIVYLLSFKLSKNLLTFRKLGQEQTQQRQGLVQSVSECMRYIKGQNYEDVFYKKIDEIREKELGFIDQMAQLINEKHYLVKFSQPITMSVILLYYVFVNVQTIDIALIFILEQSFWAVRQGFGYFFLLSTFNQQKVTLKKFEDYLDLKEIDNSQIVQKSEKIVLSIQGNNNENSQHITNQNDESKASLLNNDTVEGIKLNLDIKIGDIVVLKGPTNSGKSYLLKSILGEYGGLVQSERKIAYVGQDNWLQNKSIKENIILDNQYDEEWFKFIVKCFELDKDFTDFNYQITSSSDNISGGQKQRINLARAFYSRSSDLILIDDSFCSLDNRVMKQILTNIFNFFKPYKTIIFAINENEIIEDKADILIELTQSHQIKQIQQLKQSKTQLKSIDRSNENIIVKDLNNSISNLTQQPQSKRLIEYKVEKVKIVSSTKGTSKQSQGFKLFVECMKKYISVDRLIGVYLLLALISISLYSVFYFSEYYILMNWNTSTLSQNSKIFIYLGLDILNNTAQAFRIYFSKKQGLYASKKIHQLASSTLLKANYQLYLEETITPHKFQDLLTTQIQGIDFDLSTEMTRIFYQTFQIINAIIFTLWGCLDDPITIMGMVLFLYYGFQIAQSRVNNQQEIQTKIKETNQPIIGFVNESLSGLEYIRVFKLETYILDEFQFLQKKNYEWSSQSNYRALINDFNFSLLAFLLNYISIFSSLISISPQTAIPKVTSNSQIDQNTMAGVKAFNNIFVQLISFSYVFDFLNQIIKFNADNLTNKTPIQSSVTKKIEGNIEFVDYFAFYNSKKISDKAALKNLNTKIKKGQKVCIVGRTGSGKTSLILSLLDLINYKDGKILFDDNQIDGNSIRNNVSVIQQENIVMKGTLKNNIDPLNLYNSELDLWKQIEKMNLKQILIQNQMDLQMQVEEQGKNLSAGQKQIVSLVRSLIQEKPIILFDEANSNLDENNESLMQQILLSRKSTMIFIAHKLKYVNQFDRVIYLEYGKIVEDGSPQELLSQQHSRFYNLYHSKS